MWDGKIYDNESDALNIASGYKKDNFDVQLISAEGGSAPGGQGKYLIYTRRVATATQTTS